MEKLEIIAKEVRKEATKLLGIRSFHHLDEDQFEFVSQLAQDKCDEYGLNPNEDSYTVLLMIGAECDF